MSEGQTDVERSQGLASSSLALQTWSPCGAGHPPYPKV